MFPDLDGKGWAGLLALFIAPFLTFLAGQRQGKAQFITAVQDAAELVINQLRKECERVTSTCDALRAQHDACEARLLEGERTQAAMRREIDALMAGPVADYLNPAHPVTNKDSGK